MKCWLIFRAFRFSEFFYNKVSINPNPSLIEIAEVSVLLLCVKVDLVASFEQW